MRKQKRVPSLAQLEPTFTEVDRWFAGSVLRDHNDDSLEFEASLSLENMLQQCYDHCMEMGCASFEAVHNKNLCYFADAPLSVDDLNSADDPEAILFYIKDQQ